MRNILIRIVCAMIIACGLSYYAIANYTATQGSGTTFLDFVVSTVHIPAHVLVDGATGATDVGSAILAGVQAPIPDCAANPCTNKAGIFFNAPNVTPIDCSGTIAAGGTAQNAFTAQSTLHGFTIANIDAATGSGEPICISFTGTATCGSAGTYPLSAPTATTFSGLSSYSSPPGFGMNTALSVVSTTISHKYSCTRW